MMAEGKALQGQIEDLAHMEGGVRIIRQEQVRELAAESGRSIRDVELAALQTGVAPWRYVRNLGTIGLEGQAKLLQSTIAVVGLGGPTQQQHKTQYRDNERDADRKFLTCSHAPKNTLKTSS